MPELRVDPLSGAKTIIAAERAKRPGGLPTVAPQPPLDPKSDPFAEGNEHLTPPELYALRPAGSPPNGPGWRVRVVPNLFPALVRGGEAQAAQKELQAEQRRRDSGPLGPHNVHLDLFSGQPALGHHEVIINAPQPRSALLELEQDQLALALTVWGERLEVHAGSAYVQLIVNERPQAGASLPHTHAQLYALPFVPPEVARERERFYAYAQRSGGENLLGQVVAEEVRRKKRLVLVAEELVVLAPYASRLPYQLLVAPRQPRPRFAEAPAGLAFVLQEALRRLATVLGASPPLNLYLRTAPAGAERFCWRIDLLPRLTHIAGLELSTGLFLNPVAPEEAAAQLREVGE